MYGSYEATYIACVGATDAQLLQEHGEVTTRPQVCNPGRRCDGWGGEYGGRCDGGCGGGCGDHGCGGECGGTGSGSGGGCGGGIEECWWVWEGGGGWGVVVVGVVNDKNTICC